MLKELNKIKIVFVLLLKSINLYIFNFGKK